MAQDDDGLDLGLDLNLELDFLSDDGDGETMAVQETVKRSLDEEYAHLIRPCSVRLVRLSPETVTQKLAELKSSSNQAASDNNDCADSGNEANKPTQEMQVQNDELHESGPPPVRELRRRSTRSALSLSSDTGPKSGSQSSHQRSSQTPDRVVDEKKMETDPTPDDSRQQQQQPVDDAENEPEPDNEPDRSEVSVPDQPGSQPAAVRGRTRKKRRGRPPKITSPPPPPPVPLQVPSKKSSKLSPRSRPGPVSSKQAWRLPRVPVKARALEAEYADRIVPCEVRVPQLTAGMVLEILRLGVARGTRGLTVGKAKPKRGRKKKTDQNTASIEYVDNFELSESELQQDDEDRDESFTLPGEQRAGGKSAGRGRPKSANNRRSKTTAKNLKYATHDGQLPRDSDLVTAVFKCDLCSFSSSSQRNLIMHRATHRSFICRHCSAGATSSTSTPTATAASYRFVSEFMLKQHTIKCHPHTLPAVGLRAGFVATTNSSISLSAVNAFDLRQCVILACQECPNAHFDTEMDIEAHMLSHLRRVSGSPSTAADGSSEKDRFPCHFCAYSYKDEQTVLCHMARHHKRFKCTFCDTLMVRLDQLERHATAVHPEQGRPFYCEICIPPGKVNVNRQSTTDVGGSLAGEARYSTFGMLVDHLKREHGIIRTPECNKCLMCDGMLLDRNFTLAHFAECHAQEIGFKLFRCLLCNNIPFECNDVSGMDRHFKWFHGGNFSMTKVIQQDTTPLLNHITLLVADHLRRSKSGRRTHNGIHEPSLMIENALAAIQSDTLADPFDDQNLLTVTSTSSQPRVITMPVHDTYPMQSSENLLNGPMGSGGSGSGHQYPHYHPLSPNHHPHGQGLMASPPHPHTQPAAAAAGVMTVDPLSGLLYIDDLPALDDNGYNIRLISFDVATGQAEYESVPPTVNAGTDTADIDNDLGPCPPTSGLIGIEDEEVDSAGGGGGLFGGATPTASSTTAGMSTTDRGAGDGGQRIQLTGGTSYHHDPLDEMSDMLMMSLSDSSGGIRPESHAGGSGSKVTTTGGGSVSTTTIPDSTADLPDEIFHTPEGTPTPHSTASSSSSSSSSSN